MVASLDTQAILTLGALPGVGPRTLLSLEALKGEGGLDVEEILGRNLLGNKKFTNEEISRATAFAKENLEIAEGKGHNIYSFFDKEYPLNLAGVSDAPPVIFCSGNIEALQEKSMAVIGTREPTKHGEAIAYKVTSWFANRGWNIVSGLAVGVDTIAHQACLKSPSKTVAVLAHGLEKIYPAANKELAEKIVSEGGALITEYPYYQKTFKANFVQRDRIQAALSCAVVLVQTDTTGGSLHASKAILKYGRNLIVVGQSAVDIGNGEKKIEGNMKLLFGDRSDAFSIFKDSAVDVSLLVKMLSKDDYEIAEGVVLKNMKKKQSMDMGVLI